jgi:hypothetical protein
MAGQLGLRFRLPRKSQGCFTCANLRHGTDGFTSPPKEGMLLIFSPEKFDGFGRVRTRDLGYQSLEKSTWVQHDEISSGWDAKPNDLLCVVKAANAVMLYIAVCFDSYFVRSCSLLRESHPGCVRTTLINVSSGFSYEFHGSSLQHAAGVAKSVPRTTAFRSH